MFPRTALRGAADPRGLTSIRPQVASTIPPYCAPRPTFPHLSAPFWRGANL